MMCSKLLNRINNPDVSTSLNGGETGLQYVSFLFLLCCTKCQVELPCVSLMSCCTWAITHCTQNMTLDLFSNHYRPLVYDQHMILWAAFVSIKCQLGKLICTFPTSHLQPTVCFLEISAAWLAACTLSLWAHSGERHMFWNICISAEIQSNQSL